MNIGGVHTVVAMALVDDLHLMNSNTSSSHNCFLIYMNQDPTIVLVK